MILNSFKKLSKNLVKIPRRNFADMFYGEKKEHQEKDNKFYRVTTDTNYFVDP